MKRVNFKSKLVAHLCVRPMSGFIFRPMANFSIRVFTMALAIVLVTVSCGGGGSKQQSGNASETAAEAPTGQQTANSKWPAGAPLAAPTGFTIENSAGDVWTDWYGTIRWTVDDAKAYVEVAKAAGFTIDAKEKDLTSSQSTWEYTADNADGVNIQINAKTNGAAGTITFWKR